MKSRKASQGVGARGDFISVITGEVFRFCTKNYNKCTDEI